MSKKIQTILESQNVRLQIPRVLSGQFPLKRIKKSPCQLACPIDTKVKSYLGLIAAGEFDKAVEVVKRDNPFPGVCGRICIHPCENECERNKVDEPLAICSLKRFLADYEFRHGRKKVGQKARKKKKKIAIVGSGPAGLTAANDLARQGYTVTVFEAASEPGGMLIHGVPSFLLPKEIVRFEIEGIKEWGVQIKTNMTFGVDVSLQQLQKDYDAILLAIGAHKALSLADPEAKKLNGVIDFLDTIKKINSGEKIKSGESIVIIGGDRPAVDFARTLKRQGFDQVDIIYQRSRTEMPVQEAHIRTAEEEGVRFYFQTKAVKILSENGSVAGIECINTQPAQDLLRRKRLKTIDGSNFIIKADTITTTINREPDLSVLQEKDQFKFSVLNNFSVEPFTLQTSIGGVFAAGDCATGPKTTIEAIASGKKAARSIECYLRGVPMKPLMPEREAVEYEVDIDHRGHKKQVTMPKLPLHLRNTHKEVELGFTEQQAMEEARRCLKCGPCMECDICNPDCGKRLTVLYPDGEKTGTLLRIQQDSFPINGQLFDGQLLWERKKENVIKLHSLIARVDSELCRGCGDCVEACLYKAPQLIHQGGGVYISKIDESLCRGCGVCPSVCPSSAIGINYFSDDQIRQWTNSILTEKKIVCFICNWSYELVDDIENVAGLNMIRVLCSARINPTHIIKAFEQGAQGVLGIGCYERSCHYDAVKETGEHYKTAKNILQTLGLDPQRIQFERLSPDQPGKINKVVRSFWKTVEGLEL